MINFLLPSPAHLRSALRVICLSATVTLLGTATLDLPARSQSVIANEASLRSEQNALFDRLQAKPDDLDAMFNYAVISIKLRDYEQAIATLERILIYRDDLPKVKLELGSAYFRLGSYEVARFYFNEVLSGNPPADIQARIEEFLTEINRRTKKNAFSGTTSFGVVYSTNANLGPSERGVDVFGLDAELDPEFVEQDDVGLRASAQLRHEYDLGRPNEDAWITEANLLALHYLSETDGDLNVVTAKTGPRLALTDESGGPKIRPFVDGVYIRSGGDFLYFGGGAGAEVSNPLSDDTLFFATLGLQYNDYTSDRNESDGFTYYGEAGLQHRLDTNTIVRGSLRGVYDDLDEDFTTNYEFGGRLSIIRNYKPGFSFSGAQPWSIVGFGAVVGRWFDDPDPVVNPDKTRRDFDYRVGLTHHARFKDGWSVSLEASYFDRSSNIRNFRLDSFDVGAFVNKSF